MEHGVLQYFTGQQGVRIEYWVEKDDKEYAVTLLSKNTSLGHISEGFVDEYLNLPGMPYLQILQKGLRQKWRKTKKGDYSTLVVIPDGDIGRLFIRELG